MEWKTRARVKEQRADQVREAPSNEGIAGTLWYGIGLIASSWVLLKLTNVTPRRKAVILRCPKDVAKGRRARLQGSPREGPESGQKPSFHFVACAFHGC